MPHSCRQDGDGRKEARVYRIQCVRYTLAVFVSFASVPYPFPDYMQAGAGKGGAYYLR